MIRPICKDVMFLSQKSVPTTPSDASTIRDLRDTLSAHLDGCVGMAANMIGINKRVIAVSIPPMILVMANPEIVKKSGAYEAEEGCLSLIGTRKAARWQTIGVKWLDDGFKPHSQTFTGFTAQIIQHEIDHCDGILI